MADLKSVQELELENRITIADYFNNYIATLNKKLTPLSDTTTKSICPFHNENDPSFHYWKKHKRFHCFGCGVSGNIIRLHILTQRTFHNRYITQAEAINELISLFNLENVIKEVEETVEVTTPYEKARQLLFDTSKYTIPPSTLTINKFAKLNKNIMQSDLLLGVKTKEYVELDILAGLISNQRIEN